MDDERITLYIPKRLVYVLASALIGTATMGAALAMADGSRATQSVFGADWVLPYDGVLSANGAAVTGQKKIKFELYDAASGGNLVWSETQTVEVYDGRFSVGLGSSSSLQALILDAEHVWLAMTLIETDSQGSEVEIAFQGRQSLEPAPHTAWSAHTADFYAGNSVNAGGAISFGGATVFEKNGSDALVIDGNAAFSEVAIGEDLVVEGNSRLGASDGNGKAYIYGSNLTSSSQALEIKGPTGETMRLGANGIDTTGGNLLFQMHSLLDVEVFTPFETKQSSVFGTADTHSVTVRGTESNGSYAPLMLEGISSLDRMYIDNDEIDTNNTLRIQGNSKNKTVIHGDLAVDGSYNNMAFFFEQTADSGSNRSTTESSTEDLVATGLASDGSGNFESACFLMDMTYNDVEDNDHVRCAITLSSDNTMWQQTAWLRADSDTYVRCQAVCLTWGK